MDMEKMIVVKKSTKWWMTAVASASLAVGAIGGYGIGALTQKSPQQSSVQATMPQQNKQDGKMPGQGGQPPQGQGQGNENGMPPQMGGTKRSRWPRRSWRWRSATTRKWSARGTARRKSIKKEAIKR